MKTKRKIMPAGTAVKMVNCLEAENYAGRAWTTKSDPWRLESGTWVVLLEGYRSCFSVDCLEAVK